MSKLSAGDIAPAFTLPDPDGHPVSLSDYAGHRVIVYFYPAAMTPGCTTQAVDFSSALAEIAAAGFDVVGISPDSVEKLATFRQQQELAFPLLADPDKQVLKAYGAFGRKVLYGKEIEGVIRSTFVVTVDGDGVGRIDVAQYNVKATGHVAKLRRELKIPALS
ncbi:thioredoxin-dependent thiol peroxidase [Micropruina sonneratiae]|uniref:thioredoxin-dependent thiol peroxidase n=1 Tax=Micropruina sonneratiae TaxID=2986940 RepID=UPI0022278622|nr:thioredoxin-dependent thiol peroxidase [Micropruina sp. KQZ13P-5]MCW3158207.1 thioredoxin-dependent thiol peroxidase [Micropruina sp. KQZ13P-5]